MWKKFLKLDSLGKIGIVGGIASIIGIPLSLYLSVPSLPIEKNDTIIHDIQNTGSQIVNNGSNITNNVSINNDDIKKQSQIDTVKSILDDFEQIKVLLPPQRIISDCLKEHNNEKFIDSYEICESKSKINHTHALNLVERNISKIKFAFSNEKIESIMQEFENLKNSVYEMHSNVLAKGHWHSNNCPESIVFSKDFSKIQLDKNGLAKCALIIESYDDFYNRKLNGEQTPPYKLVAKQFIPASEFSNRILIIPGDKNSKDNINTYFEKKDELLYGLMIEQMELISIKLKKMTG